MEDSGDYDTDDRQFCFYCHDWAWKGYIVCPGCEELVCPECKGNCCASKHQEREEKEEKEKK